MGELRSVEVADVLRARDERLCRQWELLKKNNAPLVSFTMNIAGSIKNDPNIERAFALGTKRIRRQLERMSAPVLEERELRAYTGCEAIWAVKADPILLKEKMRRIEEEDPLGRLFDIDVIGADGGHFSRSEERKCLICAQPARICARSRAHSAQELYDKAQAIIAEHFQDAFARKMAEYAQKALLREALTTPKPGLVDRENSGAHRDMDLFSFADSACALRDYFEMCVRIGFDGADFARLQHAGVRAEEKMLRTAGANTHKGAIYSLGILCCALGFCGEGASLKSVLAKAAELGQASLAQLKAVDAAQTGGEEQFLRYGLTGARGEAASGFASVEKIALPALEGALFEGKSLNDAGLCALLALMAEVWDSNVIRRAGLEEQKWVMAQAKRLLEGEFDLQELHRLDEIFIQKNISTGGSADLLAVTHFLHLLQTDEA